MNTTTGNSTNSTLSPTEDWSQLWPSIMAYNFINLLLGLPANGYVLWLIVSGVGGTIESEFSAFNLTVSEILFCVSNILSLIRIYHPAAMPEEAEHYFSAFVYVARPLFQTCICLERYLAVVHPVVFLRYKPLRYRLACCSVVWLLVTSLCFFSVLDTVLDIPKYTFLSNVLYLLVLLLVQLFFCLSVLRVLRQSGPGEGEGLGREGGGSSNIKRRAFKIILLILITTLMAYLPFIITVGLYMLDDISSEQFFFGSYITVCIAIMCGLVQPLLFLHRTGKLPCLNMAP